MIPQRLSGRGGRERSGRPVPEDDRIQRLGAKPPEAHLHLGRAWSLTGDMAKARREYQNFLALWKDADADIPILKEAKAEYANLK